MRPPQHGQGWASDCAAAGSISTAASAAGVAIPRSSRAGARRKHLLAAGISHFDATRTYGNVPHDRSFQRHSPPEPVGSMKGLGRIERTDGDVISVRISERKLRSASAGIHMWLFFQTANERARPWQRVGGRSRSSIFGHHAANTDVSPPMPAPRKAASAEITDAFMA